MRTQYSPSGAIDDHLDKIVFDVHRLSFRCIFILVETDSDFIAVLLDRLFLFQSHARDLWIGEDGVWNGVVVHLDPSFQDRVVVDYLGFVVCDLFEEVTSVCVAKGPDVWLRSLEVFVDRNPTVFGDVYLGFFGV